VLVIFKHRWLAAALCTVALATTGCSKGDPQAEARLENLNQKVQELEAKVAKLQEVDEFVRPIMEQQKAQEAQEAASEPDPNARFAVNIDGNSYDGPAGAGVTIVEAFDFA
jgi:outer membrane murein-binding lipoprotein Lpp